jgi:hypothetical protein
MNREQSNQRYGKRTTGGPVLDRRQVIEAMRFLGYETLSPEGEVYPEVEKTAVALAGQVKENVMLGVLIAQEYAKHKAPK